MVSKMEVLILLPLPEFTKEACAHPTVIYYIWVEEVFECQKAISVVRIIHGCVL